MALLLKLRSGGITPVPEIGVDAPRVVIGRAPGSELQLPDPSVSSRHASLRQRGGHYVVIDEGSENGTFVGSERLSRQASHTLSDGELLRFGRVWVEVRLVASLPAVDPGASRELSRRLVEHALEQDEQPRGLSVLLEDDDAGTELRLEKARHPYLIGSHKSADLRPVDRTLPARCVELRRQGDQVYVTRLDAELPIALGDRELVFNERTLWPRGGSLGLGQLRLAFTDHTLPVLEQLERGATERLKDGDTIDPPSNASEDEDEDGDADEQDEDEGDEDEDAEIPSAGDIDPTDTGVERANPEPSLRIPRPRSWSLGDAVLWLCALSVFALSIWAIHWIAAIGRA
jgi:hypothetical protein